LSEWRDKFLAAGEASLKARPRDGREAEIIRLKSVTAQDVSRELLYSAEAQLSDQLT